jgi:hypothetical protein
MHQEDVTGPQTPVPQPRRVLHELSFVPANGAGPGCGAAAAPLAASAAETTAFVARKLEASVASGFSPRQARVILAQFGEARRLEALPVNELFASLVTN